MCDGYHTYKIIIRKLQKTRLNR